MHEFLLKGLAQARYCDLLAVSRDIYRPRVGLADRVRRGLGRRLVQFGLMILGVSAAQLKRFELTLKEAR